jgi:hypothetical protein
MLYREDVIEKARFLAKKRKHLTPTNNLVGIIAFTSFRSRDLMSCDSTSH